MTDTVYVKLSRHVEDKSITWVAEAEMPHGEPLRTEQRTRPDVIRRASEIINWNTGHECAIVFEDARPQ